MITLLLYAFAAHIDTAWIALVGTIFGGIGLKAIEHYLGRNQLKIDDATQIRGELRSEVTSLRIENKRLESEMDRWREAYYQVMEEVITLRSRVTICESNLSRIQKDETQ